MLKKRRIVSNDRSGRVGGGTADGGVENLGAALSWRPGH